MKIHIAIYFLFSIFVLISFNAKCQSINILQGVVVDSFSGEPIANASILVNKIIYQTNQYGKFGFSIEGFDSIIILVSNNNYIDKELIVKNSTVNIEINLIPITQLNQIRVSAKNRVTALKSTEIGLINIPMAIVKIIPNIGGEPDLLKAVQLIPGIKFGKEGTSNIFVRGGSQDQNLILLDDAVVYNPNHLFGFFSVFSPEAIKSFDLYKSGFPSKFGDRLSSILDIKIKEGNSKKNKTSLQVGLLSSSINNEGPIFKKRGSYFISLRSTVVDKFISLYQLMDSKKPTINYGFYDGIIKTNFKINRKNNIYYSLYFGKDAFTNNSSNTFVTDTSFSKLQSNVNLQWGNFTTTCRWNSDMKNSIFNNALISFTNYNFQTSQGSIGDVKIKTDTNLVTNSNKYSSNICEINIKNDIVKSFKYHKINLGIQFGVRQYNTFINYKNTINGYTNFLVYNLSKNNISNITSLYFSDIFNAESKIAVQLGGRLNFYNYNEYNNYNFEPRFNVRYLINNNQSIKASFTTMHQSVHLLTSGTTGLPNDLWVPATKILPIESSNQYCMGYYANVGENFEFSIEPYYKTFNNVIEYKDGYTISNAISSYDSVVTVGKGQTYGSDFFFKKSNGKFQYWIGYTISKNVRQFTEIDNGKSFNYKYDRPHNINLFASYAVVKNKVLSASWQFSSGSLYTIPNQRYNSLVVQPLGFVNNPIGNTTTPYSNDIFYADSRNNYRSRSFHRLDIAYNVTKIKKWGERIISVNIINLYNRSNTFYLSTKPSDILPNIGNSSTYVPPKLYEVSLITILPSISFIYKWF